MRVAMCLVLLVVASGCGGRKTEKTGNGADNEPGIPSGWTHKELLDHLNEKGLKLRLIGTKQTSSQCVREYLVPIDSAIKDAAAARTAHEKKTPGIVAASLFRTSQQATDDAGKSGHGYASGRFTFSGEPPLSEQIRRVLP